MDEFVKHIKVMAIKQSVIDQLPFPFWVKEYRDKEFVMRVMNTAYTDFTGIKKSEYMHRTDSEVHPSAYAEDYKEHDVLVFETRETLFTYEHFGDGSYPVVKFRYEFPDGRSGVAGLMIISEVFKKLK